MEWVAVTHAAATAAMVGLIWFVQLVHYPLLARVPATAFVAYEREHVRRTGWLVVPLMGAEAATAGLLVLLSPGSVPAWVPWSGVALLAGIWLSTALLQVPEHRRLSDHPDPQAVQRLVRSNWIRTTAWTLRVPLAAWMAWPI